MTWFECPFLGVPVELTEEREHHIAEEHPELLPEHLEDLRGTLATPDITFVRRDGPPSRLFAKWIAGGRRGRYLVAIVVTTPLDSGAPRHWIVTSYFARRIGVKGMDPRLNVRYDSVGDILYVELTPSYRDQESDMIDDYTVARTNPTTGKIESLEILFFLQRARGGESFAVPVGQMFDLVRVS